MWGALPTSGSVTFAKGLGVLTKHFQISNSDIKNNLYCKMIDIDALTRILKPDIANVSEEDLKQYVIDISGLWQKSDFEPNDFVQVYKFLKSNNLSNISTLSVPPSIDYSIHCSNLSAESYTLDNLLEAETADLSQDELENKIVLLLCQQSL